MSSGPLPLLPHELHEARPASIPVRPGDNSAQDLPQADLQSARFPDDPLALEGECFPLAPSAGAIVQARLIDPSTEGGLKSAILQATGLFGANVDDFLQSPANTVLMSEQAHLALDCSHSFGISLSASSLQALINALVECDNARRDALEADRSFGRKNGMSRAWAARLRPGLRDLDHYYNRALRSFRLLAPRYDVVALRPDILGSQLGAYGTSSIGVAVMLSEQHPDAGSALEESSVQGDEEDEDDSDEELTWEAASALIAAVLVRMRKTRYFDAQPDGRLLDADGRPLQPFSYVNTRPTASHLSAPAIVLNFLSKVFWKKRLEGPDVWSSFDPHVRKLIETSSPHTKSSVIRSGRAAVHSTDEHETDTIFEPKSASISLPLLSAPSAFPASTLPTSNPTSVFPASQSDTLHSIHIPAYLQLLQERQTRRRKAEGLLGDLPDPTAIVRKITDFQTPWQECKQSLLDTLFAGEEPMPACLPPLQSSAHSVGSAWHGPTCVLPA